MTDFSDEGMIPTRMAAACCRMARHGINGTSTASVRSTSAPHYLTDQRPSICKVYPPGAGTREGLPKDSCIPPPES